MNLQNKNTTSRTNGKRSATIAGLPEHVPANDSPSSTSLSASNVVLSTTADNSRHLSDLHLAAATATRLDSNLSHGDDTDDDEEIHLSDEHLRNVAMPLKSSVVGGRKSGSKNYAASEHKHFLFLIDRLQAWAEGPQGESWSEIAQRQHKKLGYRRDAMVLHDHFMEMVSVARTIMRENGLQFPVVPDDPSLTEDQMAEQVEVAYLELGEQLFLAIQNRMGKKLSPLAWWDADVFAATVRIANDMENNTAGGVQDAALLEQRRKEIDFEEKSTESSLLQTRQSLLTDPARRVSISSVTNVGSSLKDDLAEIKASGKLLRKFDDRLNKVEEKIDMILKHLGVANN